MTRTVHLNTSSAVVVHVKFMCSFLNGNWGTPSAKSSLDQISNFPLRCKMSTILYNRRASRSVTKFSIRKFCTSLHLPLTFCTGNDGNFPTTFFWVYFSLLNSLPIKLMWASNRSSPQPKYWSANRVCIIFNPNF